jgi:NodT family efflux transporter outer membrane factor (OMF) lipoprotein
MCSCQHHKPLLISILTITFLFLTGCTTVGPDFKTPEAKVAADWSQKGDQRVATQAAINEQWWKSFNDPALDQLVQLAYQQNLPLQIAGLRILEARARLGIALGRQYPDQNLFGSAAALGFSKNAANSAGIDRFNNNYEVGFDTTWELDFWGKFRRDVEAAQNSLVATTADYDNALVSLTAEVARTYTIIRTNEVLLALTRENVKVQEEGLRMAQARFDNGATTELDVTQARSLLENTRSRIPQLEADLSVAQNAMSVLLGQPSGTIQALMDGKSGIPAAPSEVSVSVPAELLRRRPDIRSAELFAAAQSARIGIAEAELYPSFTLVGDIGFQTSSNGGMQSNNAHAHNLADNDSFFYSFGPGFNWPIFSYGRLKNLVRVQDALFEQLLVNYQDTVIRASKEVEDALTSFLKAQESAASLQISVEAAQRSVEIALAQYREGAIDYQRVLDTQRSLLDEQDSLTRTRSEIATQLIALYKSLGGGWELREGQPIVPDSMQEEMRKRTDWGREIPAKPAPAELKPSEPASKIPVLGQPEW